MPDIEWPTLTRGYVLSMPEEMADTGVSATPMGMGRIKRRATATKGLRRWHVQIRSMTYADRFALEGFYHDDTTRGVTRFRWLDPYTDTAWYVFFDPDRPPIFNIESHRPDEHQMECWLIEDGGTFGTGDFGDGPFGA